jgi:hypothetical protein
MVQRPSTVDDKITETGVYQVHSFDIARGGVSALKNASDAARLAHRRVLAFGPPLAFQQPVPLSSGLVVQCDGVLTKVGPHWEKFSDDGSIERFVGEYDIDWRFQPA